MMHDSYGVLLDMPALPGEFLACVCVHEFRIKPPYFVDGHKYTVAAELLRPLTPTEELQYSLEGWLR